MIKFETDSNGEGVEIINDPLVVYFNFEEGFVRIDYKDFVLKRC